MRSPSPNPNNGKNRRFQAQKKLPSYHTDHDKHLAWPLDLLHLEKTVVHSNDATREYENSEENRTWPVCPNVATCVMTASAKATATATTTADTWATFIWGGLRKTSPSLPQLCKPGVSEEELSFVLIVAKTCRWEAKKFALMEANLLCLTFEKKEWNIWNFTFQNNVEVGTCISFFWQNCNWPLVLVLHRCRSFLGNLLYFISAELGCGLNKFQESCLFLVRSRFCF